MLKITEIVSSENVLIDEITRERVYNEVLSGTIYTIQGQPAASDGQW